MAIDPNNRVPTGMNPVGQPQKAKESEMDGKVKGLAKDSLNEKNQTQSAFASKIKQRFLDICSIESDKVQVVIHTYTLLTESVKKLSEEKVDVRKNFNENIEFLEEKLKNVDVKYKEASKQQVKDNLKLQIETIKDFLDEELPEMLSDQK